MFNGSPFAHVFEKNREKYRGKFSMSRKNQVFCPKVAKSASRQGTLQGFQGIRSQTPCAHSLTEDSLESGKIEQGILREFLSRFGTDRRLRIPAVNYDAWDQRLKKML